jgi:prepilin-type N-terminal cleavage/methylation domain-containing protein
MIMRKLLQKNERGFTLVEVMIALGILSFGVLAVASMQSSALLGTSRSNSVTIATNIATDRMERLMAIPYDNLAVLGSGNNTDFPDAPALPLNMKDEDIKWSVTAGPVASSLRITVSVQPRDMRNKITLTNHKINAF